MTIHFPKKYITKQLIVVAISILFVLNVVQFTQFYFQKYPLYSADFWGWQYGPKEIINYFEKQKSSYEEFYLLGEFNAPYIFFKFYAPQGCETCIIAAPHDVFNPNKKQLFAVSQAYLKEHPEINFFTKKTVYYPNGLTAFMIGEVH